MGYACPVCDVEQADAVHLANHLAITASLGRTDHEEWLEEYAPEWSGQGPEELAETVGEYALEVEVPEFAADEGRGAPSLEDELAKQRRHRGRGSMTEETARVLEEARELTRERREENVDTDANENA